MESLPGAAKDRRAEAPSNVSNGHAAATRELLSLFVANVPTAIAMFDREMRYLAASRRYAADYGLARDVVLVGRSHYEVFPQTPQHCREVHERVLAGSAEGCDEDSVPRPDGRTDWVSWRMEPWRDANGEVGGAVLFSEVVTAQVEMRHAHAATEARLRAIVDTAVDAIVVIDARGVIQFANPATTSLFGYSADELLGRNVAVLMPEPDHSAHDSYLAAYLRTGERKIIGTGREVEGRRKDGSTLPIDLSVAEFCVDGGRFFTGLMRDVTTRKLAETQKLQAERRELVVRELQHRINNMFAVTCGLVRAVARSHRDVDAYRDALLARIMSFAATQVTLARQGWRSMALREVLEFELRPYLDEGGKVMLEGPPLTLNAEAAQSFAMIVHELATNAAKYGALSSPGAMLRVGWRLTGDPGRDAQVEFRWTERGGPAVTTPEHRGFGSTVIESSGRALGGAARLEYDPRGLCCTVEMAATHVLAPS